MNERIKELAEQAELYAIEDQFNYHERFKEKLAELIVRECADLVADDDNAFDVLKHFGVES